MRGEFQTFLRYLLILVRCLTIFPELIRNFRSASTYEETNIFASDSQSPLVPIQPKEKRTSEKSKSKMVSKKLTARKKALKVPGVEAEPIIEDKIVESRIAQAAESKPEDPVLEVPPAATEVKTDVATDAVVNDENESKATADIASLKRGRGRPAKATVLKKLLEESRYILEMGGKSKPEDFEAPSRENGRSRRKTALETMEKIAKAAKVQERPDEEIESAESSNEEKEGVTPAKKSRVDFHQPEEDSTQIEEMPKPLSPITDMDSSSLTQPATVCGDDAPPSFVGITKSIQPELRLEIPPSKGAEERIREMSPELDDMFPVETVPPPTSRAEKTKKRGRHRKLKTTSEKRKPKVPKTQKNRRKHATEAERNLDQLIESVIRTEDASDAAEEPSEKCAEVPTTTKADEEVEAENVNPDDDDDDDYDDELDDRLSEDLTLEELAERRARTQGSHHKRHRHRKHRSRKEITAEDPNDEDGKFRSQLLLECIKRTTVY